MGAARAWAARSPPHAVGAVDLSLLLYPVYYCLINGAIAMLIHHRRAVLAAPAWGASLS